LRHALEQEPIKSLFDRSASPISPTADDCDGRQWPPRPQSEDETSYGQVITSIFI